MRRDLRRLARGLGLVLLPLAAAGAASGCGRPRPPNVLLVTFDALRADHLSAAGYPRETTPVIDALASEGVLLPEIVPTSCSTKASLTSLLTSLDYATHGLIEHPDALGESHETLAETFAGHGYRTIGVVASPHLSDSLGFGRGFERFDDFARSRERYVAADSIADRALAALASTDAAGRPFFAYLHFEEPHPPWLHPSPWSRGEGGPRRFFDRGCSYVPSEEELAGLDAGEREELVARYDGAIRFADGQLGRLVAALRASGELERTVVAVATDHGLDLLDRATATHGFDPHDEVLRGFLVLYDGRRPVRREAPAVQGRIFDLGPTLLAAAGLPAPPAAEGVDLFGDPAGIPPHAFATCYGAQVVRTRQLKLVRFDFESARTWFPDARRPVGFPDGFRLYDLAADPGERHDVSAERPADFERLRGHLERYRERTRRQEGAAAPGADPRSDEELERLRALGYLG